VPRVEWVDEAGGVLGIEYVEGWSVREVLGGGAEGEVEVEVDEEVEREAVAEIEEEDGGDCEEVGEREESEGMEALRRIGIPEGISHPFPPAILAVQSTCKSSYSLSPVCIAELALTSAEHLMSSIGTALARLHLTAIIHGDLTTSNMMVRLTPDGPGAYEIVSPRPHLSAVQLSYPWLHSPYCLLHCLTGLLRTATRA
jgi:TP53 regulating kinase-like protein